MNYPEVHGEYETLAEIYGGKSIARFGDGEIGVMCGSGYVREEQNPTLSKELRMIMDTPIENLLIGVSTMDPKGCRFWNWKRHLERYNKLFPRNREYYSALITRPDCGAWMRTLEYAQAVQKIWEGKTVTFVGSEIGR